MNIGINKEEVELKIALLEMIEQFAYSYKKKEDGKEHIYTGGLSVLESAFAVCELENDCCIDVIEDKLHVLYTKLNIEEIKNNYMTSLFLSLGKDDTDE